MNCKIVSLSPNSSSFDIDTIKILLYNNFMYGTLEEVIIDSNVVMTSLLDFSVVINPFIACSDFSTYS